MNTLIKVIMIFVVAAFIGIGIAGAQNDPPNILAVGLQGSVSIGGNPAPQGTAIYAKVGNTVVGVTEVQTAGVYGDTANNRLPVATNDGTAVDLYVKDVKVTTFTYYQKDTSKIFKVDLNAPSSTENDGDGSTGSSSSSGKGTGGMGNTSSKGTATPTATAAGAPKESLTSTEGTPITSAVTPILPEGASNLPIIVGAVAIVVIGGALIVLRMKGKI